MSGLVSVRQNSGGFRMMGMQSPDIREGDQVQPGMPVADVLDLSELEVTAKVGELDRANLHEGQDVLIALDAIAEKRFRGKIKNLSGTATANVMSSDPGKKFDVVFDRHAPPLGALGPGRRDPKIIPRRKRTRRRRCRRRHRRCSAISGGGVRAECPG
jgi:hypothetical protein